MNKNERIVYYNQDTFWNKDFLLIERDRIRLQHIVNIIPDDVKSIIDVGCGNGYILNYLNELKKYNRLVGVDFSSNALTFVKTEKYECDITSIPFKDSSFDLVMCNEVLEHLTINEFTSALKHLKRLTKKYIIITVPNNENLEDDLVCCPYCFTWFNQELHLRSFTKEKIKNLFYDFEILKCFEAGPENIYILRNDISRVFNKYLIKPQPSSYAICPSCGYQNTPSKLKIRLTYRIINKVLRFTDRKIKKKTDLICLMKKKFYEID